MPYSPENDSYISGGKRRRGIHKGHAVRSIEPPIRVYRTVKGVGRYAARDYDPVTGQKRPKK